VLGDVRYRPDVPAQEGVLRDDGAQPLGVDDLVDLVGVLAVDLLAVVLVDAHDRPAAVVLGDHAGREVHVQVAGQAAERVGRLDPGVDEDLLAAPVADEHLEPLAAGAVGDVRVALDQRDLVALLAQHASRPQAHATRADDHETHVRNVYGRTQ
jgi:hypothetical protein